MQCKFDCAYLCNPTVDKNRLISVLNPVRIEGIAPTWSLENKPITDD